VFADSLHKNAQIKQTKSQPTPALWCNELAGAGVKVEGGSGDSRYCLGLFILFCKCCD